MAARQVDADRRHDLLDGNGLVLESILMKIEHAIARVAADCELDRRRAVTRRMVIADERRVSLAGRGAHFDLFVTMGAIRW